MKMPTSWQGAFSLGSHFEIHLQKGSAHCISQSVSLWSTIRGRGAFTLSVVNVVLTSVGGVVSIGLCVLLLMRVTGPSGVDVANMLIEAVEATAVSLISNNHERQSAGLLSAPDIHSKVML